jgi:putative RNA 2'-phosphotransferase
MTIKAEAISRVASHALRHAPADYGLQLDEQGWVPIDELINAMRKQGSEWASISRLDLQAMIATSAKQRHEISGDRIRAIYGHSVSTEIKYVAAPPPQVLFHGTSPRAWEAIQLEGLRPMQRQYVHLSADIATAIAVGKRKANPPIILVVSAHEALQAGNRFWLGNETIWLADFVSAAHITVLGDDASTS